MTERRQEENRGGVLINAFTQEAKWVSPSLYLWHPLAVINNTQGTEEKLWRCSTPSAVPIFPFKWLYSCKQQKGTETSQWMISLHCHHLFLSLSCQCRVCWCFQSDTYKGAMPCTIDRRKMSFLTDTHSWIFQQGNEKLERRVNFQSSAPNEGE